VNDFRIEKVRKWRGAESPKVCLSQEAAKKVPSIRSSEKPFLQLSITPLDYMMMLVRAETPPGLDPEIAKARETLRFEAAKAAAPYVHARLQAVTLGGDPENPIKLDNRSELDEARHLAFILSRAMKAKAQ
jgi:hypothetical protein